MHSPAPHEATATLDQLIPARKQHSIKEAVISFFLVNSLVKPEGFHTLIKDQLNDFQKFDIIQRIGFQFREAEGQETLNKIPSSNIGFRFHKFENGQTSAVLEGENQKELGRTHISFHDLDYHRWADFRNNFVKYIQILSDFRSDLFTTAFSLHYIDEFYWTGDGKAPVVQIFNAKSSFLPPVFFESENSVYLITTQKEVNGFIYYERLEIRIDENRPQPLITISHNITQPLNDEIMLADFITDSNQLAVIDQAHNYNKSTLKSIFTSEVCEKINLI